MPEHTQGFAGCFGVTNESASFDPEMLSNCSSRAIYMAASPRPKDPVTASAQPETHKREARPERVLSPHHLPDSW